VVNSLSLIFKFASVYGSKNLIQKPGNHPVQCQNKFTTPIIHLLLRLRKAMIEYG
jgi:hypothetical protein